MIIDILDKFEDIDTSDVDCKDSVSSDFFKSFVASESEFKGYDDFDCFTSSDEHIETMNDDADIAEDVRSHHTAHGNHSSQISFGSLTGRCHHFNCLCKQFEGTYGAVCSNCYHNFDKHY